MKLSEPQERKDDPIGLIPLKDYKSSDSIIKYFLRMHDLHFFNGGFFGFLGNTREQTNLVKFNLIYELRTNPYQWEGKFESQKFSCPVYTPEELEFVGRTTHLVLGSNLRESFPNLGDDIEIVSEARPIIPPKTFDVGEVYRTLFETALSFRTSENFDTMPNGLDKRLELIGISEELIGNIAGLAKKFEVSNTTPYLIARNYPNDCTSLDHESFDPQILVRNKTLQGTYTKYFYPE